MLKWAVNGARQSYLPTVADTTSLEHEEHMDLALPLARRKRLKRKSSELLTQRRKLSCNEKLNLLTATSTPLHPNSRISNIADISPLHKMDSLKDISNILRENIIPNPTLTAEAHVSTPRQYASTLPTFDVEYSPNGLIPGPILALRGMGIADTYFEKPRYLTEEILQAEAKKLQTARERDKAVNIQPQLPNVKAKIQLAEDESTLSSSKMGDMTLERMIDAILESTRKERKHTRFPSTMPPMSPTYTRAEDPASDLHEYWDAASAQYLPQQTESLNTTVFNEREVRGSPSLAERLRQNQLNNSLNYQLRRQRAVRRKRRLSKIGKSVRNSAQKLALSMAVSQLEVNKPVPPTPVAAAVVLTPEVRSNISPDSGHNSTSDVDEFNDDMPAVAAVKETFDATKRRLSFNNSTNSATLKLE